VVVGGVVVVLALVGTGRGVGLATTFVATFLGVLAALRLDALMDGEESDGPTEAAEPSPAPTVDPERGD
jgi:hypothetical protein